MSNVVISQGSLNSTIMTTKTLGSAQGGSLSSSPLRCDPRYVSLISEASIASLFYQNSGRRTVQETQTTITKQKADFNPLEPVGKL